MGNSWTIKKVLDWAVADFSAKGMERPRLEAELLLGHVLKVGRLVLYTHFDRPLSGDELSQFRAVINRRRSGECAAYITGTRDFWSMTFAVTPDVLVPRPETETLVETALPHIEPRAHVLDLCCGSGCIAVTVAKERPQARVHASDISAAALAVARQNATTLLDGERIAFVCSDLFSAFSADDIFDVIISNPPYVIGSEIPSLSVEVRGEPRIALDGGGDDGLEVIRAILKDARKHLRTGGHLFIELDPRQAGIVAESEGPAALTVRGRVVRDLAGVDRIVHFAEIP
jgi:release factor glutamine methyltransferase